MNTTYVQLTRNILMLDYSPIRSVLVILYKHYEFILDLGPMFSCSCAWFVEVPIEGFPLPELVGPMWPLPVQVNEELICDDRGNVICKDECRNAAEKWENTVKLTDKAPNVREHKTYGYNMFYMLIYTIPFV